MNFFTNTSIIIFLMIFSKIEYSIAEENDSQLDDILDENVQDIAALWIGLYRHVYFQRHFEELLR